MSDAPQVGEIVHYVSYGTPGGEFTSQCRAAIVTEVPRYLLAEPLDGCPNGTDGEWVASLAVLNPTGAYFNQNLSRDEHTRDGGTWHTPAPTCKENRNG
ncbi:hypothetical protein ACIQMV_08835 [Streptomyces sp. NPDC091412]|uniref:hypothetical protein n=1 Tax=Streptomyces sp. NPDC091412 TaxID=3366002 RepID=UPI003815D306